jgi:hypothetical protein
MAQLPPDSHCAIASQFTLSAFATPAPRAIGATAIAEARAVTAKILRGFFTVLSFRHARAVPVWHDGEGRFSHPGVPAPAHTQGVVI